MSGNKTDVKIKSSNHHIGDGAGACLIVSTLDLGNDYKALSYQADLQKMEEKLMSITVVGSEKVNNIDCYIVEIKSATGEAGSATYWVSKESNPRTLKYKLIIAEMGGATMTGMLK